MIQRVKEWFTGALNRVPAASATAALIAAVGVSGAYAQDDGLAIEEVMVTAQKRSESVQDVPLSITAFGEEFIKESGIDSAADMTMYAPGLSGSAEYDSQAVFTIRGIGTYGFSPGADSSVGIFVDDVSVGRAVTAASAFFDLERVEVVRGPQGTLFGRNTSAGAINVITNKPAFDANALDLTLGFGNEGQQAYEVIGNLAASDNFAVRVGFRYDERDGTNTNTTTGQDVNTRDHLVARGTASWLISDALSTDLTVETYQVDNVIAVIPTADGQGPDIAQNFVENQDIDSTRTALKFNWDASDSLSVTSITGIYTVDMVGVPLDVDATDVFFLDLREPWEIDQFSQELRLNGVGDNVDWFIGASFYNEEAKATTTYNYSDFTLTDILLAGGLDPDGSVCDGDLDGTPLPPCVANAVEFGVADNETTSFAIYGDVAWQLSDRVKLTVGGRFTNDEKEMVLNQPLQATILTALVGDNLVNVATAGTISDKNDWKSFNPRIALDFAVNDDVLLYGSVSSGYKSGGYNKQPDFTLAEAMPQRPGLFNEEENLAYEFGVKSTLLAGRAQLNASAFFYDYTDLQLENQANISILIENAADAETKGIELEGRVLITENFELMGSFATVDAAVESGVIVFDGVSTDITGKKLLRAPETTASLIGRYTVPVGDLGELSFRGEYAYTDEQFYDIGNTEVQDSYSVINARIAMDSYSERWSVALIGENVGDEKYFANITAPLGTELGIPAFEGLYRLEVNFNF